MTRSNQRMLLLLADGRSGLLRIADAERLQARPRNLQCQEDVCPWMIGRRS
jgi:hypothetical protein